MSTKKIQILNGASIVPKSDWNQTDETKADYIKNKPTLGAISIKDTIEKTDLSSDIQATLDKADTAVQSIDGLATETYVDNKVAGVVNSAPETLDTLNELAAALGNDANFATTVTTQIGSKVDKIDGKGLSTNDYTDDEKTKLSGIENGANKTVVDTALSTSSTNPVQNKVVNTAINNCAKLSDNNIFNGNNTFSNPITVSTPTDDAHAATKKYVDESKSDKISKLEAHTTDTNNPHNVTPEQIGAVDNNVIGMMLSTKENKIGGTPTVGQVPVIKTVNSDGSYTAEWGDIASGGGYKKIGYTDDCDYKVSASEGGKAAFEAAISAASDGDTILVLVGDYGGSGTLTFKHNLSFVGIGNPVISFPITVANDSVFNFETNEWTYLDNEYTTNWSGFTFERRVESIVCLCTDAFYVANTLNASNCIFKDALELHGKLYNCKLFKGVKALGYSGFSVGGLYLYDCDMLSENISGDGNTYIYGGTYRFKNSENTIASSFNLSYWQGAELYTYGCTFSGEYGYNNGGIDKCISGCTIYSDSNPFDASHCENCVLVTVTPIS